MGTQWREVVAKEYGLDELARAGDATGLALALGSRAWEQSELNFAFQAACGEGFLACAKVLLAPCSIISVSRGARRAAEGGHPDCMALAFERLEEERSFVDFDLALGLRDADAREEGGLACAKMALARASAGAGGWALSELLRSGLYERARALLLAGADMDVEPSFPPMSSKTMLDGRQANARAVWAEKKSEAGGGNKVEEPGSPSSRSEGLWIGEMMGSREVGIRDTSMAAYFESRALSVHLAMAGFQRALDGESSPMPSGTKSPRL
jgi:hypothetical protein